MTVLIDGPMPRSRFDDRGMSRPRHRHPTPTAALTVNDGKEERAARALARQPADHFVRPISFPECLTDPHVNELFHECVRKRRIHGKVERTLRRLVFAEFVVQFRQN